MGEDYLSWLYGTNNSMLNINRTPGVQNGAPSVSAKFRSPMNQSIGPSYSIAPQTSKGVVDLNPEVGGNADGFKGKAVGSESGTPWGMIASIAATNLFGLIDGLNPNIRAEDLVHEAGTSSSSYGGIGYQVQNQINADRIRDEYDRNNINKLISGNIGGFIGGLFGKNKLNREIRKGQEQIFRTNSFNKDYAATQGINIDFMQKYGNQYDQMLHAAHGKDYQSWINNIITTIRGGSKNQNAWVSKGEGIYDPNTGNAKYVPFGENDTAPAHLKPQDVVFGDLINPHTGKTFKKDAEQYIIAKENLDKKKPKTTDKQTLSIYEQTSKPLADALNAKLQDLAETQHKVMEYNNYTNTFKAKYGKDYLPKMSRGGKIGGPVPNIIAGLTGAGMSIGQYFDAKNQSLYKPNTYVRNPYENRVISDLYGIRINPYNINNQLIDAENRGRYAINYSGGLGAGQKLLANVATTLNSQNAIANSNQAIHEKNNAYRSAAGQAALNVGAQDATNMMNALRYDSDMYAKAHAARLGGMQTAQYNLLNQIQQYIANEYKRRMGNSMIDLYSEDLRSRK